MPEFSSVTNGPCLFNVNRRTAAEDILKDVVESDILKQWNDAVSLTHIPLQLIEMFRLKLYCLDWQETDMKSAQWRNRMIDMTVRLLQLEARFH